MNKWIININNKKIEYTSFNEAVDMFLKTINDHFLSHSNINKETDNIIVYDSACLPDSIEVLFHQLYYDRTITDEKIILEARLGMLLSYLASNNCALIKENALKSINKSYIYQDEGVNIKIDYSPNEIKVELYKKDDDSYLYTNAFIIDDENRDYYFKSHQICHTAERIEDIGKAVILNITLEKCESGKV